MGFRKTMEALADGIALRFGLGWIIRKVPRY